MTIRKRPPNKGVPDLLQLCTHGAVENFHGGEGGGKLSHRSMDSGRMVQNNSPVIIVSRPAGCGVATM